MNFRVREARAAPVEGMGALLSRQWHHLPSPEVLEVLGSDPDRGLDLFEVANRQQQFGPNVLTRRKGRGPLLRFLVQFHQPLVYLLLAAVLITAVLQKWVDSGVILGVVLLNAAIGFLQESKALGAIEALARSMTSETSVLRAGRRKRIDSKELVPGDIVFLDSGDKAPADLRLLRCRELQIDESMLTGESVPVRKNARELDSDTVLADRRNMAYASTLITHGTGVAAVVATGDQTEMGRIASLIASGDVLATPLTAKIARFSRVLLWVILGFAAVTFVVGLMRGETILDMFMSAVALAVGAIPEGLPAAMTITLAIGVGRMAKRHAIVRKLPAVETLGSTTVICSDKTGTLTQNQMTVREVVAGGGHYEISGAGYSPDGNILPSRGSAPPEVNRALEACLQAGLLCNEARLTGAADGWAVEGDPTEGALIVSALKAGIRPEELQRRYPRLDAIPFESQRQYMATLHDAGQDKPRLVYLKGSLEKILPRCRSVFGADVSHHEVMPRLIQKRAEEMAARGLRVLAFAQASLPAAAISLREEDLMEGLTFLGMQGMIDPLRPEAATAVKACRTAGVRVKLITGDHAGTALAIAREIGLDREPPRVLTGKEISALSDVALIEAVEHTAVFARVSPEQKLRVVEALQACGNIVAMTGDGVNDAPALRRADIGVAMGIAGTEVAKEAADMVLTDDNFASIEAAVEEGRGVFDNLVKFITWTLPTNFGEGLVILAAVFAGITLPILPVQVLWINTTTAVLLGLMLAFEPKEPGIMLRAPRDPRTPILTGAIQRRIALVSTLLLTGAFGLFNWERSRGAAIAEARTVAVNVFVVGELFYLFNCRSLTKSMFALGVFTNRWVLGGAGTMLALQMLFTYVPALNRMFGSAPIGPLSWALITAVGLAIYALIGFEKWLQAR